MFITAFDTQAEMFLAFEHYVSTLGANFGFDYYRGASMTAIGMAVGLMNMFTLSE